MGEPKGSPVGDPVTPTLYVSPPMIGVGGGDLHNHQLQNIVFSGAQNTSKAESTPDSYVVFLCPEFLVYDRACG
ncbi:hypothetical protein LUZ48_002793 [Salmonella enterica]|nr:hypothetical protein [Salmonella enterica]